MFALRLENPYSLANYPIIFLVEEPEYYQQRTRWLGKNIGPRALGWTAMSMAMAMAMQLERTGFSTRM